MRAPGGGAAMSQFWDGEGAHVDFANAEAVAWWQAGCRSALLSRGVDTIWNDNNEYEIYEEGATCADGDAADKPQVLFAPRRGLQPLLMARASMDATKAAAPGVRAFGISRAMSPGCQRLCSTWTGDNDSSWASLRWGLRCCMHLALSGIYHSGTDIGGFSGPVPEAELLARWYQAGVVLPRFVSNSWKACGTITAPWLHADVAPVCIAALRLRYALMPYMYTLARAAADGRDEAMARPTLWDFGAADAGVWAECDELMLGPSLLAAPVVAPGARERALYLPAGPACWYDFHAPGTQLPAGSHVTVAAPLDTLPLFCPAGAVIPTAPHAGDSQPQWAPHDCPRRTLRVYAFPGGGASEAELFEDDGLSADGPSVTLRFTLRCSPEEVALSVRVDRPASGAAAFHLPYDAIEVLILPRDDTRRVVLSAEGDAPQLRRCEDWQLC